jgi:Tfp pilus assembly PilM family ATPase
LKAERFIALEIGTASVRLAVFECGTSGSIALLDHGSELLPDSGGEGMAREAVVAVALKKLLDRKRLSVRRVRLAIDGQSVFARLVSFPPVEADKLNETLRHEAVQNIPFPINEVVWDAEVVSAPGEPPEALLVAAKTELVGGYVDAVAANGLAVAAVDAGPAALANCVRFTRPSGAEAVLLADVGDYALNLVFIDGSRTFFRTVPLAGDLVPRLVQEVECSLTFYNNLEGSNAIQRVLVSGRTGIAEDLSGQLSLPVEPFDPLQKVECKLSMEDERSCGVLAGLAMRGMPGSMLNINLEPDSLRNARMFQKRKPIWIGTAAISLITGLVWLAGIKQFTGQLRQETDAVNVRIRALEQVEQQLIPIENEMALLEERADAYREAIELRGRWMAALIALEQSLPDGMFLLNSEPIRRDREIAGLRVEVLSYLDKEPEGADAVLALRDQLQAHELFSSETSVFKRPTKRLFARRFVLDIVFEEPIGR